MGVRFNLMRKSGYGASFYISGNEGDISVILSGMYNKNDVIF